VQAIATILVVLKAGKFYAPLDSSNPRARLSKMLEELETDLFTNKTIASKKHPSEKIKCPAGIITPNRPIMMAATPTKNSSRLLDILNGIS